MSKLKTITKRSGIGVLRNSTKVLSSAQWATLTDNLASDIGELVSEFNSKINPILNALGKGADDEITGLDSRFDAIVYGLDGTTEFTDRRSTKNDPFYLFSSVLSRPLTIKESLVEVHTSLSTRLDSLSITIRDSSDLNDRVNDLEAEFVDLESRVDVLESEEGSDITPILSFTGMDDENDSSPGYSDHGPITTVVDGDSLEEAIQKLDEAIDALSPLPPFSSGHVLFGDGTNTPVTDSDIFFDVATTRLGIGTAASPEQALDVRGIIQHQSGVISRGGNARGTGASDFQVVRTGPTQVASGGNSFIAAGEKNKSSGPSSFTANNSNEANATDSSAIGTENIAGGASSFATGIRSHAKRTAQKSHSSGTFSSVGDCQNSQYMERNTSVGAATVELFINGTSERISLGDSTSYVGNVHVIGRSASGDTMHYHFLFTIKRGVGAATTALVGSLVKTVVAEDLAAADATVAADSVNGALIVQATGVVGTTIRWAAIIDVTEINF